ncbi:hypothetical protein VTO73DRAFT_14325 [Trametes versicolor]
MSESVVYISAGTCALSRSLLTHLCDAPTTPVVPLVSSVAIWTIYNFIYFPGGSRVLVMLLNDDVVLMIIDNLRSQDVKNDLRALSQTSRRMRTLCMPVLHSTVRRDNFSFPFRIIYQVPESVRPYVRELILLDKCDRHSGKYDKRPWSRAPLMCNIYKSEAMAELLPAMPLLQIVTLKVRHDSFPFEQTVYGLSWDIVKAILSARGLQELDLDGHFYCLTTFTPDPGFSPAPLTAFRSVTPHGFRVAPATQLEDLEITYPDPEDQLYSHLPPTLKRLSLDRFTFFAGYNWTWYKWAGPWTRPQDVPMPRAREIWQIVRKCNTPNIRTLKLEYLTDDDEDKLLTYIPKAFPHLESIHLCRYGIQNDVADNEITLKIGQAISPLSRLRTIQVHLDAAPSPELTRQRRGFIYTSDTIEAYVRQLKEQANVLAQTTGPSLETIEMFVPDEGRISFDVVRTAAGDDGTPHMTAHVEIGAEDRNRYRDL